MSLAAQSLDMFTFSSERRWHRRFPLALAVQYRLLGKGERSGSGKTCNISSSGVFFEVAEREPFSGSIELIVNWPCVLDGACALKLLMKGRVVRNEGWGIAIESNQYEFRTAGLASGLKGQELKLHSSNP
jgi:hypothetical protein